MFLLRGRAGMRGAKDEDFRAKIAKIAKKKAQRRESVGWRFFLAVIFFAIFAAFAGKVLVAAPFSKPGE
jgi:hypothetical protein